jgi:Animal haem peroxidase
MANEQLPSAAAFGAPSSAKTTQNVPRRHAVELRGLTAVPSSALFEGRFGRIFRALPVFKHDEDALRELARRMVSPPEDEETPEGQVDPEETTKPIPAGFTYLGQFVDHDLTFDPVSSLDRQNDPDALTDFRTPRFDLDCVYGRGPADQPYMYDQERPVGADPQTGLFLLLGERVSNDDRFAGPDLPRNAVQGRALIGDPRNDENLIVSQLHCVMLRFHNAMLRVIAAQTGLSGSDLLKETQRRVRWHYQWAVINDFLPRIVGEDMVNTVFPLVEKLGLGPQGLTKMKVRTANLEFYRPKNRAFMPVEFSVAAYRFGHSMIRPIYRFNSKINRVPIFSDDLSPNNLTNLNGFRPLPQEWGFEWMFFFDMGGNPPTMPTQKAYRIDPHLVDPLGHLPPVIADRPRSLAERNLLRGFRFDLPSGQTVARAMGVIPLDDKDLLVGDEDDHPVPISELHPTFKRNAPLWYYILREAEAYHEGNQLGPIGGRIVAEVVVGILVADRFSYISMDPLWRPDLADSKGNFGMSDLIKFAIAG